MHPLAHHAGEDSLVNLLLLGGGGITLMVVEGRARLAAARARLARLVRGVAGVAGVGGGQRERGDQVAGDRRPSARREARATVPSSSTDWTAR
jgi:hypothetical protein